MNEYQEPPEVVRKQARADFLQRLVITLVVLWMMSTQALLVWAAVEGHYTRQALLDCTAPSGDCYKEAQKQTASVVESLNKSGDQRAALTRKYARLAAACADKPGTQSAQTIEICINQEDK